jgi:hypothetical protein
LTTPIETALAESMGMIADYTARYDLETERWTRLARALCLEKLHQLLNAVPDAIRKGADDARQELRDIRDQKFPTLKSATAPVIAIQPPRGDFGAGDRIKARIGSP